MFDKFLADRLREIEQFASTEPEIVDPVSNVMVEHYTAGGVTTWRTYILVDGKIVAERFTTGSTSTMQYFILDHLGSVAAIAAINPTTGAVTATQQAYDAWGKMRVAATGADDMTCSLPPASLSTRGFTNQEQMADVCLVNLNARLYDPQIGRFMSADSTTEAPYNLQDLNRYSYVLNNPLSLTDPSGTGGFFSGTMLFRQLIAIVAAVTLQEEVLPAIEAEAFATSAGEFATVNAGIAGGASGYIATGRLNGALMGAAEGVAFAGVHVIKTDLGFPDATGAYSGGQIAASAIMHGMVGGLFSIGQQGGFKSGFIAAGMGDLASVGDNPNQFSPVDLIKSAVGGGIGSMLGGGKFANGAITGAFAYAAETCAEGGCDLDSDEQNQVDPNRSDAYGNKYGPPITRTINCGSTVCNYQYQTLQDSEGNLGARLYIWGNGEDTNWIQSVSDNGAASQSDCEYSPCPFYNSKLGQPFLDTPRDWLTFSAQTSLVVPNGSGGYAPVVTFNWGFQLTSGSVVLTRFKLFSRQISSCSKSKEHTDETWLEFNCAAWAIGVGTLGEIFSV